MLVFLEASDYAEIVEEEGDYSTPGSEYHSIPSCPPPYPIG